LEPACRQAWDGRWDMGVGSGKREAGSGKMGEGR